MAVVSLTNNVTRVDDFDNAPPGTIDSNPGGGPGASSAAGLNYQGTQNLTRRISATGSDHGFTYAHTTTHNFLTGAAVFISKSYTVLTDLNDQVIRVGSSTSDYHAYLVGDDGTLGSNQDFLSPQQAGYIIQPIEVQKTAWIFDGITGSPDVSLNDVYGPVWNVGTTTGAGLSSAFDPIDLTDDGLFLVGGDGSDTDGQFQDFLDEDEGTVANRWGFWVSKQGVFFIFGNHVIGRNASGTSTITSFTDSGKTLIFPGGFVSEGFNGIEIDLDTPGTLIDIQNCTFEGRGRVQRRIFFDTDHDVSAANDRITAVAHGLNDGDQVIYSDEGGTEDIGPDASTGQLENVTASGPGTTGDRWYVNRFSADEFSLHATPNDGLTNTSAQALTESTSGNGERHALTVAPDTRPDLVFTANDVTVNPVFTGNTITSFRNITAQAKVTFLRCTLNRCQLLTLNNAAVTNSTIDRPTTYLGEGFISVGDSAELGDITGTTHICAFDNTTNPHAGGHAWVADTTASNFSSTGNTFTGYGPNPAEFDGTTDVDTGTETITLPAGHGYVTGDPVFYNNQTNPSLGGLSETTIYFLNVSGNDVTLHLTRRAAMDNVDAVNITSTQSGTHELGSANAAFFNDTGGAITISIASGDAPTYRNGPGASTTTQQTVTLKVTVRDQNNTLLNDVQVAIYSDPEGPGETELMNDICRAPAGALQISRNTFR